MSDGTTPDVVAAADLDHDLAQTNPEPTNPEPTGADLYLVEGEPGDHAEPAQATEPPPSYVKLAMRNMVKKGGKSLFHFSLTTAGLVGVLVGLAYLTR